jgi:hypothetical protein
MMVIDSFDSPDSCPKVDVNMRHNSYANLVGIRACQSSFWRPIDLKGPHILAIWIRHPFISPHLLRCCNIKPELDTMKTSLSIFLSYRLASPVFASSSFEQESLQSRALEEETETIAYGTNFFVDSENTEYDAYQTSWRYLGHIVKCGYPSDRYDGGSGSGSGDSDQGNHYCQRYLMWAAVS